MPTVLGKQLVVVEGKGATVTTSTGQTLIDATSGLWYSNVGHGREDLAEVAYRQMLRIETHNVFGRFSNDVALEFAELLAARAPMEAPRVFFTSGGSESVETACKLARLHWQLEGKHDKKIILSRDQAYHGLHGFGTSISGQTANRANYGSPSLVPETARIDRHDLAIVEAQVREIGPENIAAIFAEPVQGSGGIITPVPGYLAGLQKIARENDILFVADEVITGFGRTGELFASTKYDIEPDLLTFAKGVTSGYIPLGGVFISPRIAARFYDHGDDSPVFRHGITYSGHSTACAVGIKHLAILDDESLVERANVLGEQLVTGLEAMGSRHKVKEIRISGLMCGVELVPEVSAEEVGLGAIADGVIIKGMMGNTLQVTPPFVTTENQIDQIVSTLDAI
jgi:adenosylmethionine-8-amino-7-oxononanoate aminotransferase